MPKYELVQLANPNFIDEFALAPLGHVDWI
jgi:hypothetical protein